MKILWTGDLFIKIKNKLITLDPQRKTFDPDYTLISHAHSDHTAGFKNPNQIITTPETSEIFEARSSNSITNKIELNYLETYEEENFNITIFDSGHVLGSSQFMINNKKNSILYTSDINCVDSLTLKAAKPIDTDILIIESTYGKPQYIFPSREEIYNEIIEWAISQIYEGKIPVFKAYSLGKSQEIIKLLNNYLKIPVIVDSTIAKVSNVYNKTGADLNFINLKDEKSLEPILQNNFALIISSKTNLPEMDHKKTSLAFTSGWAIRYKPKNYSESFPLSSHADYYQLLEYIKNCNPKRVYTIHGYSKELAKSINNYLRIPASAISDIKQRSLSDYM
jgi:Cft2 family RNA processing exonuclease